MATPWREYKKKRIYPKLVRDIAVDVAIIGGGMAGVLAAYRLSKAGKKVALVEKGELGGYATMDTTAFITEVIDSDLTQIASIFDDRIARLVWQSGRAAIEEYEKIIESEKISCEFVRCPNYVYASSKKQLDALEEDYKTYKRLKLPAELNKNGTELGFKNFGFLEVPDQAKFHVTKFLYALATKASALGALIFENSEAVDIAGEWPITVETKKGSITANDVIIATYKPLSNKKTHLKKAMYRSYVYEAQVPQGLFKEALYEDMSNPYYYFRIDAGEDFDRMIVGGEDHKDIFGKALAKKSFGSLKKFTDKLMAGRKYKIVNKWNGPILEPTDGLPLIGRIKPHHYVATGFSGNGMTYSMISSLLLPDLIMGRKNEWLEAYSPERTLMHPRRLAIKTKDYVQEFFGGAAKNMLS